MRRIVYYVATSVDGYISGPEGDISGFEYAGESTGVKKYFEDLQNFDTVIMGRNTYEAGYQYGLKPGGLGYPHMNHYIFSDSLKLEEADERLKICPVDIEIVKDLKQMPGKDIYLCGGGQFAGWLLDHKLIDVLTIKLNPIVLGTGIPLFGKKVPQYKLGLAGDASFTHGLKILTYNIIYEL